MAFKDARWRALILAAAVTAAAMPAAFAAEYPTRPIRFVVPFAPGGTSDIIGRTLSAKMQESLGQAVVVDNRGGAGGSIGTELVAKATPDGYTLILGSNATHAIVPYLYKDLPYHPISDFAPVSMVAITPIVLAANPELPVKSVADLIALAKSKPGVLAYGSSGIGSTTHIAGETLTTMAGIQLTHVPYKSASAAYPDVFSGRVPLIFDTTLPMLPHINAERVRPLAVTTPVRASNLPNVPTLAEAGVPGYSITLWIAVYAPADTPAPIVARLNKEIQRALNLPEVRDQMALQGAEIATGSAADLLAATRADLKRMGEIVKAAKIEAR